MNNDNNKRKFFGDRMGKPGQIFTIILFICYIIYIILSWIS